jgi:hypothetical protein
MLCAEHLLTNSQGALMKLARLREIALVMKYCGKVV